MLVSTRDRYPLPGRLEMCITSYSVHLIVTLITLPSLIWHITSVHDHYDYGMPDDWVEIFNKAHFTGGRGWLWGFLFVVVPIDCIHALLALDHYHARRYERGSDGNATKSMAATKEHDCAPTSVCMGTSSAGTSINNTKQQTLSIIRVPLHPARTYHPLLTARHFSIRTGLVLVTLYDAIVSLFLLTHTISFFYVLHRNRSDCNTYTSIYPDELLDPMNTQMSVFQRCQRICADMYVSGGYDIAWCVVLLGVHMWHLGLRAWDVTVFGVEEVNQDAEKDAEENGGKHDPQDVNSLDGGESGLGGSAQSFTARCPECSVEELRKRASHNRDGTDVRSRSRSVESAKWSDALLECLVP